MWRWYLRLGFVSVDDNELKNRHFFPNSDFPGDKGHGHKGQAIKAQWRQMTHEKYNLDWPAVGLFFSFNLGEANFWRGLYDHGLCLLQNTPYKYSSNISSKYTAAAGRENALWLAHFSLTPLFPTYSSPFSSCHTLYCLASWKKSC